MEEQRSKKLEQIRKLLDKASDKATSEHEAAALRKKADDLMLAYTISEFEVNARKPKNEREVPERRSFQVVGYEHPLKTQLIELHHAVVLHCRCRAVYSGLNDQKMRSVATVIGFPSDLEYVDMLFTSLQVQMARELEPHPDPSFSEEENIALLKEAGLKWVRIHELLYPDVPWERRHGVRYTGVYTKYCKKAGKTRMYTSPITYQRNFAEGFVGKVGERMREIRRIQNGQQEPGSGMELVLVDIKQQVDDAFNAQFGKSKGVTLSGRSKLDHGAMNRGRDAGDRADLGQQRVSKRKELA